MPLWWCSTQTLGALQSQTQPLKPRTVSCKLFFSGANVTPAHNQCTLCCYGKLPDAQLGRIAYFSSQFQGSQHGFQRVRQSIIWTAQWSCLSNSLAVNRKRKDQRQLQSLKVGPWIFISSSQAPPRKFQLLNNTINESNRGLTDKPEPLWPNHVPKPHQRAIQLWTRKNMKTSYLNHTSTINQMCYSSNTVEILHKLEIRTANTHTQKKGEGEGGD